MVQIKGPGYTSAYVVVVFLLFVISQSDVIGGIVDNHCLNVLFIIWSESAIVA
jgi:hypothetical protein